MPIGGDAENRKYALRVGETIDLVMRPRSSESRFNLQRIGLLTASIGLIVLAVVLASTEVPYVAVIPLAVGLMVFHPRLLFRGYSSYLSDWEFANSHELMVEVQAQARDLDSRGEASEAVELLKSAFLSVSAGPEALVDSYRRIGGLTARNELIALTARKGAPGLRAKATCALGSQNLDCPVEKLETLLADGESSVRMAAIDALVALDRPDTWQALESRRPSMKMLDRWYLRRRRPR